MNNAEQIETREEVELTPSPITEYERFEVAFRAFNRTCETMAEAVSYCNRNDFDPNEIKPVVIGYKHPVPGISWPRNGERHPILRVGYYIFE